MSYLEALERLVGQRLEADAIGRVVFVRAHLQLTADHGLLLPLAAGALDLAARWTGGAIRSVYPQGGIRQGVVSLLIDFEGGQSAIVSAEATLGGEASVQALITGQSGTIRFDDFPEPGQLADLTAGRGQRWVREIAAALASGRQIVPARE